MIKPQLCKKMTYEQAKVMLKRWGGNEWVVEPKFDGIRAIINNGVLFDRRGNNITHKFPEFYGLDQIKGVWDGEIIAPSGEFNDISGRVHLKDKLQIRILSKKNPAIFVCWDCLRDSKRTQQRTNPLHVRRDVLEQADFRMLFTWFDIAPQEQASSFEQRWQQVLENGEEGLILKRKVSRYEEGSRKDWLKVKAFVETTALFTTYEDHPKGVTIETQDGRRVVVNGHQAEDVKKALFDADVHKMTVTNALGCGQQKGFTETYRGVIHEVNLLKKVRIEVAVNADLQHRICLSVSPYLGLESVHRFRREVDAALAHVPVPGEVQRMAQPVFVVPLLEVIAGVGAAAFVTTLGGDCRRLGDLQQVLQLKGLDARSVVGLGLVFQVHILDALAQ